MTDNKNNNLKNPFKKSGGPNEPNKGKSPFNFYWIYAIVIVILISLQLFNWNGSSKTITYNDFLEFVQDSAVQRVVLINDKVVQVTLRKEYLEQKEQEGVDDNRISYANQNKQYSFNLPPGDDYRNDLKDFSNRYNFEYTYEEQSDWGRELISWLLPIGILIIFWLFIMRRMSGGAGGAGGQIFNIGKSKAQVFEKGKGTDVSFKDVAGLEGAKEEIQEIVEFLKTPSKYTELGAKIPQGALLVGPPGTGKTLLAKAVAGEAKVPFFSLSGSDFVEMFVGVGASRVRDLFKQAKEKSPSIIFIDEIDAIGRARGKNANFGSNDERENTLNQLLTEMDGFGTNTGVIILAATNRADILDKALLRAGRFDRQIYVDMPDLIERKEIFEVHLKKIKLDEGIDVDLLAKQTPGFSGADIANICNEAALIAARSNKKKVERTDFNNAIDRIIGGLEKKHKLISDEEKRTIAYHEAGHATVSWLLEHASPLVKVTIVPRGQSLGAAWYLPEERHITTTEQLFDEMCATMGGRAAEKVVFNKISTGALSDLEKVNKQAKAMVSIYGLNDKIGNLSFYDSSGQDYTFTKPYSEETARLIDIEISKLIESAYSKAIEILENNKEKLAQLADLLLEKEVIFKEDLEKIFGKREFETEAGLKEFKEGEAKFEAEHPVENKEETSDTNSSESESTEEKEEA